MDHKNHLEIPPDIVRSIFEALNIPSIDKALLDSTNDKLDRALQDELSKEILEILNKISKGKNLDDMIEVYREQLRLPNLTKQNRKAIRKKKRTRKIRHNISLGSSDMSSSESRSLNSEEEMKLAIVEAKGKKKVKKGKSKR